MRKATAEFLKRYLISDAAPLSAAERWRSALAGMGGVLLLEALLLVVPAAPATRQLLAPIGASAVILYCMPNSPLGQPWSIIGGLGLSALIGIICGHWIAPLWLAIAIAVAASIWLMARLRCLHPPGGAMAIVTTMAAHQHAVSPAAIGFNIAGLVLGALAINNLIKGRSYPQCITDTRQARTRPPRHHSIAHEDLNYALTKVDRYLDISEHDLIEVYNLASTNAFRRGAEITCADLMTREVISIEFATELTTVWSLLQQHHVKALPVLDRSRRVIGLLTLDNFLAHVAGDNARGQAVTAQIRDFLLPTPGMHSNKAEVAGQIMSKNFVVARSSDALGSLVELLAQQDHPHAIPIVDTNKKLVGILTQTDIITALFRQQAQLHTVLGNEQRASVAA